MIKKLFNFILAVLFLTALLTLWANRSIDNFGKQLIFENVSEVPKQKAALLLGTSRYLKNGNKNLYFFYRIDAAVELFKSRKIEIIIISGDNSRDAYNEPQDMKDELVARGVPAEKIFLDYAGFRTLDSVIRARDVFSQDSFVVVSQRFHNERAVYLAHKKGLKAYGYNAKDVTSAYAFKTRLREWFARDKVFIDLWFGVDAKFLGEKVRVE